MLITALDGCQRREQSDCYLPRLEQTASKFNWTCDSGAKKAKPLIYDRLVSQSPMPLHSHISKGAESKALWGTGAVPGVNSEAQTDYLHALSLHPRGHKYSQSTRWCKDAQSMRIPARHVTAYSSVSAQSGGVTASVRLWSQFQPGFLAPACANEPFASMGTTLHCCSYWAFGPEPAHTPSAGARAGLAHAFPLPPCLTQLYTGWSSRHSSVVLHI